MADPRIACPECPWSRTITTPGDIVYRCRECGARLVAEYEPQQPTET